MGTKRAEAARASKTKDVSTKDLVEIEKAKAATARANADAKKAEADKAASEAEKAKAEAAKAETDLKKLTPTGSGKIKGGNVIIRTFGLNPDGTVDPNSDTYLQELLVEPWKASSVKKIYPCSGMDGAKKFTYEEAKAFVKENDMPAHRYEFLSV